MPIQYEQSTVHTPDGFALTLFRHRPAVSRPQLVGEARPVLLLPGFGSNRFTFGVHRHHGLPEILAESGRDVWIGELRGSRSARWLGSGKPVIDVDAKRLLDVPAIVEHICRETGAERVDLIGHSLGGLIALLVAGGSDGHRIGRVATLATPGTFKGVVGGLEASGPLFRGLAKGVESVFGKIDTLGIAPLARTRGPLPHLFAFQRHFLPGACTTEERRLYLDHAIEAIHGTELAQLTRWVREGCLTDRHGRSLEPLLQAVTQPVLVTTATRDRVVTEAMAYAVYAKIGSHDKHFRIIGREHGATRDYAHADFILSHAARRDVLEPVAEWLGRVEARRGAARVEEVRDARHEARTHRPTTQRSLRVVGAK
jgi:pimeloyl-ACP methyl ester carboxylesterase